MHIKTNFLKKLNKKSNSNHVIFCNFNEQFTISYKNFSKDENEYLKQTIKNISTKSDFYIFNLDIKKKIILINLKKTLN